MSLKFTRTKWVIRRLARAILTLMLAFLASATLMRFAPGWNVEETDLDPRFSSSTAKSIRDERSARRELVPFYRAFLSQIVAGDLGKSEVFHRPVGDLIAERAGTTALSISVGVLLAWLLAIAAASVTARASFAPVGTTLTIFSGALLSCPSALLAIACLILDLPPAVAIAAVVFPRTFPHAHEQLRSHFTSAHVLLARARGIGEFRLFQHQILPGVLGPLAALAGTSVPLAFGAAIPVESLADSHGLGQLAWLAASGRDLPLLVALTLLLTSLSVGANLIADLVTRHSGGDRP